MDEQEANLSVARSRGCHVYTSRLSHYALFLVLNLSNIYLVSKSMLTCAPFR